MRTAFKLTLFIAAAFFNTLAFALVNVKHMQVLDEQAMIQSNFPEYPHLTDEMVEKMSPYLIHERHPMKARLDKIFENKRPTKSKMAFLFSGFKILDQGPRSYIVVAKHRELPGRLVKCYFDDELREKWDRPSWYWLCKRCEGARKIAEIINKYKIRHFKVPSKYLYILPLLEKTDPIKSCYIRHPCLLLVTDMNLVPAKENRQAWKTLVNEEVLNELYIIITLAKGASYRADNIAYSHSGKFCFIDCEYPSKGPEYDRIGAYLNEPMKAYWDSLVERGEVILKLMEEERCNTANFKQGDRKR
jgi:hypothetical protein